MADGILKRSEETLLPIREQVVERPARHPRTRNDMRNRHSTRTTLRRNLRHPREDPHPLNLTDMLARQTIHLLDDRLARWRLFSREGFLVRGASTGAPRRPGLRVTR